jgi:hypothetical protein
MKQFIIQMNEVRKYDSFKLLKKYDQISQVKFNFTKKIYL